MDTRREAQRQRARELAEAVGWIVIEPAEYGKLVGARSAWVCGRWHRRQQERKLRAALLRVRAIEA